MKITPLAHGLKPPPIFHPMPGSVQSFIFSTSRCDIEAVFAASNFYAPEFYKLTAKNKAGAIIWSGGQSLFLDAFFSQEFISDTYNKLILQRISDTGNPSSGQILLIDLTTGTEKELTPKGAYAHMGHFQNFDGVFYMQHGNIYCIDFETGKEFLLNPMLKKHFPAIKTWWTCPVKNCIIVVTANTENNIALFDIYEEKIKQTGTLLLDAADNVNLAFTSSINESVLFITAEFANRNTNGILAHTKSAYYKIEF
ncbi:MAG TPA: hypothetical protein VK174_12590 [Chitinophagales bacterium]|nr:hypothetical protein [Chitinophagales bacterium]